MGQKGKESNNMPACPYHDKVSMKKKQSPTNPTTNFRKVGRITETALITKKDLCVRKTGEAPAKSDPGLTEDVDCIPAVTPEKRTPHKPKLMKVSTAVRKGDLGEREGGELPHTNGGGKIAKCRVPDVTTQTMARGGKTINNPLIGVGTTCLTSKTTR